MLGGLAVQVALVVMAAVVAVGEKPGAVEAVVVVVETEDTVGAGGELKAHGGFGLLVVVCAYVVGVWG